MLAQLAAILLLGANAGSGSPILIRAAAEPAPARLDIARIDAMDRAEFVEGRGNHRPQAVATESTGLGGALAALLSGSGTS